MTEDLVVDEMIAATLTTGLGMHGMVAATTNYRLDGAVAAAVTGYRHRLRHRRMTAATAAAAITTTDGFRRGHNGRCS